MASPTVRGNALEWSSDGVRVEITALGGRVSEVDDPTETLPNRPTFHYAPPGYVLDAEVFAIKFTADAVTPWNDQMNGLAFSIRMGGTHVETPLLPKPLSGNPGAITLGGVLSRVDNSDRWVFKSHAPYNAIDPSKNCEPFYKFSAHHDSAFQDPSVCPAVTSVILSCRLTWASLT